jgi:transposase-like protein
VSTAREIVDRQARVAQLVASGANVTEVAKCLGVTRPTVYRDLAKIRERALDRVLLDEEDEAAAIAQELDELDALFSQSRRHLEERTEPGTREHAALLTALVKCKQLKLHVCAELGVYRKAAQRLVVFPGDELANLEGEALDRYAEQLEESMARLNRGRGRGRTS